MNVARNGRTHKAHPGETVKYISPNKAGLVLGAVIAAWHVLWSALVAVGWAQTVVDFVFRIHFISPPYTIDAFDLVRAAMLVLVTFGVGYVFGAAFAALWNRLHRRISEVG